MVVFVFILNIVQNVKGLLGGGGFEDNLLETTFESPVFFNVLAVFVQRCRTDTLQFAACEGRLEEVGGVHAAGGVARTHHRVQFVDEEDDIGAFLQLFEDCFHAFLKLSAVFGARHKTGHVEAHNALMQERARDVSGRNLQCKSLCQSGFADTRLADEHGVVFLSAAENLGDAL